VVTRLTSKSLCACVEISACGPGSRDHLHLRRTRTRSDPGMDHSLQACEHGRLRQGLHAGAKARSSQRSLPFGAATAAVEAAVRAACGRSTPAQVHQTGPP